MTRSALALLCAVLGGLSATQAAAGPYPARPVHIVVPYAPGGLSDVIARQLGAKLADDWGQSVIVDNRPGASAIIGTEFVAKSVPDGYTLLMISSGNLVTNPSLFEHLPYDTVRDLAPVMNVGYASYVLDVHPGLPVSSIKELIALARAHPGEINAATPGNGTGGHLALELFMSLSGTKFIEVAYKGAGPALADTLAGQTQVIMDTLPTSLPHIRAGTIRALAQSSRVRSPLLPEVPTLAEAGLPGYEFAVYNGLLAPAGTPPAIIDSVHAEIVRLGSATDLKSMFERLGVTFTASTPEELAAFIRTETTKWAAIIKEAGIKMQ
ncbi:MAG: tripartite tricarboxylate transporter substrate binding protein [Alphaproteobacteria bacterium]|nr:tripartite tricarboxylate transporter substrate binding protein [Alphaproteobacteria bacterium]